MRIAAICRPHLRGTVGTASLALVLMILETGLNLLIPWPLKVVFDNVLVAQDLPAPLHSVLATFSGGLTNDRPGLLGAMIVVMLLVALARAATDFLSATLMASIGHEIVFRIRLQTFDHLQHLSLAFHRRSRVGDLSARLTTDIQAIQDVMSSGLNTLITNALSVLGIALIVGLIDWHVALIITIALPLLLGVAGGFRVRIQQASRLLRSAEGEVSAGAQEKLNAIQVVQAFSSEERENEGFARQSRESLLASRTVSRLGAELAPMVDLLGVVGLAAVTWLGGQEVLQHHLTPGYLLVFITYYRSILSPVRQLTKLFTQFTRAEASAERIEEILRLVPEVRDEPGARLAPRFFGAVTFENVSFSYHPDAPILRELNLTVRPGTILALVGPTGTGKSSLLSLIPRFNDPRAGRVLIDGIDVREYTLASLRSQISVVLQEPLLFSGTIRENIAYGRPGLSLDEVIRASRAVGLHDLIVRLPAGYDTVVGERGGTLSGGQRQLVAIARALVRDTPIVLLDEPTTGLDAGSEALVMRALYRLIEGRTTIVSTHQLRTIERADQIAVLDRGRIRELGSHVELSRARGLYARWQGVDGSPREARQRKESQEIGRRSCVV